MRLEPKGLKRSCLAALLTAPVILVACQRPAPPPEPVVSPAEAACAARAAEVAGVDAATVDVVATTSTKTGATVYAATVGDTSYTCVVEADLTISTFEVAEVTG